ncbi:hypothetical protein D3C86_1649250 [compost metagenome]
MLKHLFTEASNHAGVIVRTVHPVIAKLNKAGIAKLLCNSRAYVNQLVINAVKFAFMLGHKVISGSERAFTQFAVQRHFKWNELRQVPFLTLEHDFGRGDELGVFRRKLVLQLQILDNFRAERPERDLRKSE